MVRAAESLYFPPAQRTSGTGSCCRLRKTRRDPGRCSCFLRRRRAGRYLSGTSGQAVDLPASTNSRRRSAASTTQVDGDVAGRRHSDRVVRTRIRRSNRMSFTNKARTGGRGTVALALAGAVAAAVALTACGGGSSSGASSTSKSSGPASTPAASTWSLPNANLQNTRAISSSITSANVSKLRVAWRLPLKQAGALRLLRQHSGVRRGRDDLPPRPRLQRFCCRRQNRKGAVDTSFRPQRRISTLAAHRGGPERLALANGTVYGEMPAYAFALSAATGKQLWRTPNLAEKQGQGFNIAPQVHNGRVYLSTSGQLHGGVAYALDAKHGQSAVEIPGNEEPRRADSRRRDRHGRGVERPRDRAGRNRVLRDRQPVPIDRPSNQPSHQAPLQQQHRRAHAKRAAEVVLPGGSERLPRLGHAGLADLRRDRRSAGCRGLGEDGLRLRDERQHGQAAVEEAGRQAQRA